MTDASKQLAGILLLAVTAIEFGGLSLLALIRKRDPGYLDNPLRQAFFRAGHAHAGVLVVVALLGILYVDQTSLSETTRTIARESLAAAPILVSAGFFLSVVSPRAERPNRMLVLVYLGAVALAVGVVTLGAGLL
ncbi:MAG TPA: hypothetical protein VG452_02370 [Egibacteraceae bacterium]|nr:hypothetical protein [Egibacteraceae bacterium]